MMNEIQSSSPTDLFRAVATDRLITAAKMTPHELLDEFMRLQKIIDGGRLTAEDDEGFSATKYTDDAKLAIKELGIVNGTTQARFGFRFFAASSDDLPL